MSVNHKALSTAIERYNNGKDFAKRNLRSLTRYLQSGESIKLVSHSMGAAFSEGVANYLTSKGYSISHIIHINPFQAGEIKTTDKSEKNSIITLDYQNTDDIIINSKLSNPGDISGADYKIREKSNKSKFLDRHSYPLILGAKFWDKLKMYNIQQ